MDQLDSPYTVALCEFPELPVKERMIAEARYICTLERQLGDANAVADTLRTVLRLQESDGSLISQSDQAVAACWAKATTAAREAGYQGLGAPEESYFDVRLG